MITEILGWFLIAAGVVGLSPLLTGRDHGTHATPMSWRRLRLNVFFPIALGCNALALNAHGLTMLLLRVAARGLGIVRTGVVRPVAQVTTSARPSDVALLGLDGHSGSRRGSIARAAASMIFQRGLLVRS